MSDALPVCTEDPFLGGSIRLRQPATGYRAAIDPVMLAAAVDARPGQRVFEAGAGHGTAAICLARRVPGCRVVGIELQPALARLANDNARLNGLAAQVDVMVGDLGHPPPRVAAGGFDHVMANPPHLDPARSDPPADAAKASSQMEGDFGLKEWIDFMLRMAKPGGALTILHRADRLDEILPPLRERAGGIVVFPLWPKPGRAAKRVVVRARKASRAPTVVAAGLVVHEHDGSFTPEADAVLCGGALAVACIPPAGVI